jgi:pimeloyl-ACP methyl ester carboxylesterase
MARELEVNDSSRRTSQRREGTMNATRLIEEWRRQGRILEVEGANTVLWRMGQGETVICIHGVPTSGFLYRKLLPELASRGLEGVTLDLPGLGLADRPADKDAIAWEESSCRKCFPSTTS